MFSTDNQPGASGIWKGAVFYIILDRRTTKRIGETEMTFDITEQKRRKLGERYEEWKRRVDAAPIFMGNEN